MRNLANPISPLLCPWMMLWNHYQTSKNNLGIIQSRDYNPRYTRPGFRRQSLLWHSLQHWHRLPLRPHNRSSPENNPREVPITTTRESVFSLNKPLYIFPFWTFFFKDDKLLNSWTDSYKSNLSKGRSWFWWGWARSG